MVEFDDLPSLFESLVTDAGVQRVYGEPITHGDRTVVPVARVTFGFGFGFGAGDDGGNGAGGGGGGGGNAEPVGVVEITADETRLVRFSDPKRRVLPLLVVGVAVGYLLGRR